MCPEKTAVKAGAIAAQQTALVLATRSHLISGQHVTQTTIHSRLICALFHG